jgi:hypothetical protein
LEITLHSLLSVQVMKTQLVFYPWYGISYGKRKALILEKATTITNKKDTCIPHEVMNE